MTESYGNLETRKQPGVNVRDSWITIQKNTFTKWANTYLQKSSLSINDLFEDLKDGLLLIALLKCLSKDVVARKYNKTPKMRIHKLDNLNCGFAYMASKGITLTNIDALDICDGNNKLVLGLIWTLIKKFEVTSIDVDGVSGKEGLLLWCQRSLGDYENISMTNFSSSWKDGLAFCGLLHRFHPHLIDYENLTSENASANLELAFSTAEKKLGITQLLEVQDIVNSPNPDDKSIVTYVSLIFQQFASGMQTKKAVTTICKAVDISRRHEKWREQYSVGSIGLLSWQKHRLEETKKVINIGCVEDIKNALGRFYEYKQKERPPKEADYMNLESCISRLQTSCNDNNRIMPTFTVTLLEMKENWKILDEEELCYEKKLRQDFERFQTMEYDIKKFSARAKKLETWANEKLTLFTSQESTIVGSTAEVESHQESYLFFEHHQLPRYCNLLSELEESSVTLSQEHSATASSLEWLSSLKDMMTRIQNDAKHYHEQLQIRHAEQLELDQLTKECNVLTQQLHYDLEEVTEELEVPLTSSSVDGTTAARDKFVNVTLPKVENVIQKHDELSAKLQRIYTAGRKVAIPETTVQKTDEKIQFLKSKKQSQHELLEKAVSDAIRHDKLCGDFAQLAAQVKDMCDRQTRQMQSLEGSMEQQLVDIKSQYHDYKMTAKQHTSAGQDTELGVEENDDSNIGKALGKTIARLEEINAILDAEYVYSNAYTTDTIQSLRAIWSTLGNVFVDKIESLESQISLEKVGNLTPEQLAEIKEVFDHFDEDKSGSLGRTEFIAACQGFGLYLDEEEIEKELDDLTASENGSLGLLEFSNYCATQLKSGSSQEDTAKALAFLAKQSILTPSIIENNFKDEYAQYLIGKIKGEIAQPDSQSNHSSSENPNDIEEPQGLDPERCADIIFSLT